MFTTAAELTTGSELKTWVLLFVGNIFVAILAVRAVGYWFKEEWGRMITLFASAVFVAAAIWFPEQMVDFFKALWQKLSGTP